MSDDWGALPLLADKSAWTRAPRRAERWGEALRSDRVVTCAIIGLELLYRARTADDVVALREELSSLRHLPVTRGHVDAAVTALVELAALGSAGEG